MTAQQQDIYMMLLLSGREEEALAFRDQRQKAERKQAKDIRNH